MKNRNAIRNRPVLPLNRNLQQPDHNHSRNRSSRNHPFSNRSNKSRPNRSRNLRCSPRHPSHNAPNPPSRAISNGLMSHSNKGPSNTVKSRPDAGCLRLKK